MMARRERNSEKSRQDILRAAEQHFAEKGFYGARVDEIAATAIINSRNRPSCDTIYLAMAQLH